MIKDPQASPPPMASVTIKSFFFKKPFVFETESARGIEAAEVLPWSCTVVKIRSFGRPIFLSVS